MANVVEIVLKATDQTARGFNTALTNMESVRRAADAAGRVLAGLGVAAAGSLAAMAAQSIRTADELFNLSQKSGVSVETLSRLKNAAELSDVSLQSVATGLRGLNRAMSEAAANARSDVAEAFAAIGVSVTDSAGKLKSSEQVLLEVSDRFKGFEDDANKAALAMKLFGKSGTDMIPLLNEGADAIRQAGGAAATITSDMARNADAFGDNLTTLKQHFQSIGIHLANELLPHLVKFSDWLVKTQNETGAFSAVAKTAVDTLKGMAVAGHGVFTVFQALGKIIGAVGAYLAERFNRDIADSVRLFELFYSGIRRNIEILGNMMRVVSESGSALDKFFNRDFKGAAADATKTLALLTADLAKMAANDISFFEKAASVIRDGTDANAKAARAIFQSTISEIKADLTALKSFALGLFSDVQGAARSATGTQSGAGPARSPTPTPSAPTGAAPSFNAENRINRELIEGQERALQIEAEMRAERLKGEDAYINDIVAAHQRRVEQINDLNAKYHIEEGVANELAVESRRLMEEQITEAYEEGLIARAEITQLYREADIQGFLEYLQTKDAMEVETMEAKQSLMQTLYQAHSNSLFNISSATWNGITTMVGTFQQAASQALTGIITGAVKAKDAFAALGQAMLQAVIQFAAQVVINTVIMVAAQLLGLGKIVASSIMGAGKVAAAWSAAATSALIATYGGAASAAFLLPPLIAANVAFTKGMVFAGGVAHGGMDYVPDERTFLLNRGERVVQPTANRDLTDFLSRQQDSPAAGPALSVVINLDGRSLWSGMAEASRDGRLIIDARAVV